MAYLRILKSYGMDIGVIFDKYQCETEDEDLTIMHPTLDNVNNYDLIIITQEVHYRAMKEELDRMMFGGTILSMSEFISQLKGIGVVV